VSHSPRSELLRQVAASCFGIVNAIVFIFGRPSCEVELQEGG
jgi:hypothetical protein